MQGLTGRQEDRAVSTNFAGEPTFPPGEGADKIFGRRAPDWAAAYAWINR
jgi:hypothetical protein